MELLKNAWNGWLLRSGQGKLAALLLCVLLLAWLLKLGNERQRKTFLFGAIAALLCIFPVSAVLFMLYQTRFYDYEWIWAVVPMTAVIALGVVLLLERLKQTKASKKQKLATVLLGLAIILLCSSLGKPKWTIEDQTKTRAEVANVLAQVRNYAGGEICLWAPKEVMEAARSIDADVTLLYGRTLWQEHLNAFSYEEDTQDQRDLYVWMQLTGAYQRLDVPVPADTDVVGTPPKAGSTLEGISCIQKAVAFGANEILLPGSISEEEVLKLEQAFGVTPVRVGAYLLLDME